MTKPKLPWVKMVCFLPIALINVAGGLFLLFIPFLFPIGIALLVIAAMPYAYWLHRKIQDDVAYEERDHTLNEGEEMPWEEPELTEEEVMEIIINRNGRGSRP